MHLDLNHVYSFIFSGLPINQSFLTGEAAISRAKVLCPRRIAGQSPRPPNTQDEVKERKQLFSNSFKQLQGFQFWYVLMWNLKQFEGASLKSLVRVRQRGTMAVWSCINTQNFRESANLPWPNSCQPSKMQQVSCVQLGCCCKPTQGLVLEELQKTHRIDMFEPCKKMLQMESDTGHWRIPRLHLRHVTVKVWEPDLKYFLGTAQLSSQSLLKASAILHTSIQWYWDDNHLTSRKWSENKLSLIIPKKSKAIPSHSQSSPENKIIHMGLFLLGHVLPLSCAELPICQGQGFRKLQPDIDRSYCKHLSCWNAAPAAARFHLEDRSWARDH